MKYDIKLLEKYKEDKLLRCQQHKFLPLLIWNYTERVQFDDLWDDITLNCRGLVTDVEGNIVAKPFKKFFNIEQNKYTQSNEFKIYEKLDGSLGVLFNYKGEWVLATRGSFTSEQAVKGAEILKKYKYERLDKNLTYCFEIIYQENRICVDYGETKELILLAIFDKNGDEYPINNFSNIFPIAKQYDFIDYKEIKKLDWKNSEGFVIRFSNGDRCKIKFNNYVELHRKLSNISPKFVWELFCNKQPIETYLEIIPDEFHEQVKTWYNSIKLEYQEINSMVRNKLYVLPDFKTRKEFALAIKDDKEKALLFKLFDSKDIHIDICKLIKPINNKSLIFEKENG